LRRPTHFYETLPPYGGEVPGTAIGGFVSVALFLASRRAGITRHPTLWSPDFPLRAARTIAFGLASSARSGCPTGFQCQLYSFGKFAGLYATNSGRGTAGFPAEFRPATGRNAEE